ncbi:MAG: class B sortase [Eubacterium sp.]|nr:class B sortase [Eubacterium sp.]
MGKEKVLLDSDELDSLLEKYSKTGSYGQRMAKPQSLEDRIISKKREQREQNKRDAIEQAKKQRKRRVVNMIMNVVLGICIVAFIGCGGYLLRYYLKIRKAEKGFDSVKSMISSGTASGKSEKKSGAGTDSTKDVAKFLDIDGITVQEKFEKIYTTNKDFVGWLSIPGTKVDYPVMQTKEDEEYYLHKDFNKEDSTSGTLFLSAKSDFRSPSDNVLIYGHNMKAGTMFNLLLDYEKEDFYQEHHIIHFDTLEGDGTYEVIAAFRTEISDDDGSFKYYDFYNADSKEAFALFVEKAKSLTPYHINKSAEYGEKLLTLSTCAYHADEGRYVVVAKKVK